MVAVLTLGGFLYLGGDPEPVPDETARVEIPQVDPRLEASKKALEQAIAYEKENPREFVEMIIQYDQIAEVFASLPPAVESAERKAAAVDAWRSAVDVARQQLSTDVDQLVAKLRYSEALAMLDSPDQVFQGADDFFSPDHPVLRWIGSRRKEVKILVTAQARLQELEGKAARYGEHEEIALAILAAFPEKYETEAAPVWSLKQETLAQIKRDGLSRWIDTEQSAELDRVETARVQAVEEESRRAARWASLKDGKAWFPHLGRHNLYNWISTSDAIRQEPQWRLTVREDQPLLIADNGYGNDMWIGPFTNHWKDYVLEFEMRLLRGEVSVSPRTTLTSGEYVRTIGDQTSPMFVFSEANGVAAGKWVRVTIEVNGTSLRADVAGRSEPLVLDPEESRIPELGGFIFWVPDGSQVELRGIQSKLINSTRDGPF